MNKIGWIEIATQSIVYFYLQNIIVVCLPQLLQEHQKDADSATIILEINTTINVAENLGKIGKSKQKILMIEKQDVYDAQFVNLQIFTFVLVEK